MTNLEKREHLGQRTFKFGQEVILLCRQVLKDNISNPLVNQLIRSGTSIGANYLEANNASSKKDFVNKIFICKKEAEETKYWLKMIQFSTDINTIDKLYDECHQLTMIFQKIVSTIRNG